MSTEKKPVQLADVVAEFVRRGGAAQSAVDKQLRLGAAFGWECPRCAVINDESREKCVSCGTVKR